MPNTIYQQVPQALQLADYIITKAEQLQQPVTNLKLNKLLYLLNRQSLMTNQRPLFDEPIASGVYGPNVPSVYAEYANYGGGVITKPDRHLIAVTDDGLTFSPVFDTMQINEADQMFINQYLLNWLSYDQWELVKLVTKITEIR